MRNVLILAGWLLFTWLAAPGMACAGTPARQDAWSLQVGDQIALQVVMLGDARAHRSPLVVLHGGPGGEHSALLPLVEPLAGMRQIVLFDQRGSLRSPAAKAQIGFDAMVEDIERLRLALGTPTIDLLSHSMGSLLAYGYLHKYPGHVGKLVLVAPQFPLPAIDASGPIDVYRLLRHPQPTQAQQQARMQQRQAQAQQAVQQQRQREGLAHEPRNDIERSHVAQIEYAAWSIHDLSRWREVRNTAPVYSNREVYGRWVESVGGMSAWNARWRDFIDDVRTHASQVRFIVGDQDETFGPATQWPGVVATLPGARLHLLTVAGHMPWIDQPQRVHAAIIESLDHGDIAHPGARRRR